MSRKYITIKYAIYPLKRVYAGEATITSNKSWNITSSCLISWWIVAERVIGMIARNWQTGLSKSEKWLRSLLFRSVIAAIFNIASIKGLSSFAMAISSHRTSG